MTTLVLSNNKKKHRLSLAAREEERFFVLQNSSEHRKKALLAKGLTELKLELLNEQGRLLFQKEYLDLVAGLGARNNSLRWWANDFSQKNEYTTKVYGSLCFYHCLINALEKIKGNFCVLIECSDSLAKQLKIFAKGLGINYHRHKNALLTFLIEIPRALLAFLKYFYFLLAIFFRKFIVQILLGKRIKKSLTDQNNLYLIRTWLDERFLKEPGERHRRDSYFGRLAEFAANHGYNVFFLAGTENNFLRIIRKINKMRETIIIPLEYFLTLSDFIRVIRYIVPFYPKSKERIFFMGKDVTSYVEGEVRTGGTGVGFLNNLLMYYSARGIARRIKYKFFIQTFENYAWEKMTVLGLRSKQAGRIFGFQHAYISRSSFKYFPGVAEKEILPLPDKIITLGENTKRVLERFGSYDPKKLVVGCALRQEYIVRSESERKPEIAKILIPLNMVKEESVAILNFLQRSGVAETDTKVIIRCHPTIPFESFSPLLDFRIATNFIIDNKKPLIEELKDTDLVLYTWTTVAVEAARMGIPVIYLDMLYPMDVDPLFECPGLHRKINDPKKLMPLFKVFYEMDDARYMEEKDTMQNYLKAYFYPVNEENLKPFFTN